MKKIIRLAVLALLAAPLPRARANDDAATGEFCWKTINNTQTLVAPGGGVVGRLVENIPAGATAAGEITALDARTFRIVRRVTFNKNAPESPAFISFDFVTETPAQYWMIPAVSYNGNHYGRGNEPKGAAGGDGRWRTISYRRTAVPAATYSEGGRFAVALWSGLPKSGRDAVSCSLQPEEGGTVHRVIWPEE
ncbi:MAG: hypothetical protein LBM92_03855, partial [Opitutaceae bacterium]|nr:hypothetical protein [Opitutaceae bacterium]